MNDQSTVVCGARVTDSEDFRGTIRYIGPVAIAKDKNEIWLGIEWDTAGRGKHDGSCVDTIGILHRYFSCLDGSGSFVKQSKVKIGKSFLEVLKNRYVEMDAPILAPGNIVPDAFVMTSKGHQKNIELLGEQQIRKWQQIRNINKIAMRNDSVGYCDADAAEFVGHFTEIDLQDNLLWQWKEVANFSKFLPALTTLMLHGNKLQTITPDIVTSLQVDSFASLRVLALNSCNIKSWSAFTLLEPFFRNLEELYLSSNNLDDIPHPSDVVIIDENTCNEYCNFPNLRVLDISGCKLTEWEQVLFFGSFVSLEDLRLDDNPISNILPCPKGLNVFKSLIRISISSTKISNWSCVDCLSTYPALYHLRLSHIPLFSGKGASEVRPIIIGRLPLIRFFNGSIVNEKERYDSEKSYLRRILREIAEISPLSPEKTTEEVLINFISVPHPRYMELRSKYEAELVPLGDSSGAEAGTIAAELISITFRNLSFLSGGTMEPVIKKLPLSMTLSKLRILVKQLFNVASHLQLLSVRQYKNAPPILLEDEDASLRYYGISDGADLFVNSIDG